MAKYRIAQFVLDQDRQVLLEGDRNLDIEPRIYDLLSYFCANPNRLISKDELIDKVWSGTVVTDNAVSRAVTKLRKLLGEDSKNPRFIKTHSRRGYSFIAEIIEIDALTPNAPSSMSKSKSVHAGVSVLLLLGLVWLLLTDTDTKQTHAAQSVIPVTRDDFYQWNARASWDSQWLAWSRYDPETGGVAIVVQDFVGEQSLVLSETDKKISHPFWHRDNQQLGYLYADGQACEIRTVKLLRDGQLLPVKAETGAKVAQCYNRDIPNLVYDKDASAIYLAERRGNEQGFLLYRIDAQTGARETLPQPTGSGEGNYHFDLDSDGKRVLILHGREDGDSEIHVLELDTGALVKTTTLDYRLDSAVWSSDGHSMVHPTKHPSYELRRSALDGEPLGLVSSIPERINDHSRIPGTEFFLFSAYLLNMDIRYLSPRGDRTLDLGNSSVIDYIPALSNTGNRYAFISKRSGRAEVWGGELGKGAVTQLSHFDDNYRFYDLRWSPDDTRLALLSSNQIRILDSVTGSAIILPLEKQGYAGLSWRDNTTVLFSAPENGGWQLLAWNTETEELHEQESWSAAQYDDERRRWFFFTANNTSVTIKGENSDSSQSYPSPCSPLFIQRRLNFQVVGDSAYCQPESMPGMNIYRYSLPEMSTAYLLVESGPDTYFHVNRNGLVHSFRRSMEADIMRTGQR